MNSVMFKMLSASHGTRKHPKDSMKIRTYSMYQFCLHGLITVMLFLFVSIAEVPFNNCFAVVLICLKRQRQYRCL